MDALIFANSDIIYKQVLKDIKVLEYSALLSKKISTEFDKRFRKHVEAIYNNSPKFFKEKFVDREDGFKLYQKYYFLLFLINSCLKLDGIPPPYKRWADARNYDCVDYFLQDPYPNEKYEIDFKKVYNELISYSGESFFLLSVVKDIRDKLSIEEKAPASSLQCAYVELSPKYMTLVENEHLIFDFSKMNNKFQHIGAGAGAGANIKYNSDLTPSAPTHTTIESFFNNFSKVSISEMRISKYIFKDLDKYSKLYIVFSSVFCNSGHVSGFDNENGCIVFSGKFVKDNGNTDTLKYIPLIDTVPYIANSCNTKRLQFYITDEDNRVIPYRNTQAISYKDVINVPFRIGSEDTGICEIHSDDVEWRYSIHDKMISLLHEGVSLPSDKCLIRRYNYIMCASAEDVKDAADAALVRFMSENDYEVNDVFLFSSIYSHVGAVNFISGKHDIYNLTLRKTTPTYYIFDNVYDVNSEVFKSYKCASDVIREPLTFEKYCKAVYLSKCDTDLSSSKEVNVGYVKYLLSIARYYVYYKELNDVYVIGGSFDTPDTYLKIYLCNETPSSLIHENTSESSIYHKIVIPNSGCVYVKVNEKFMLSPSGSIYVLRENGIVYSISSDITYTFYIKSPLEMYSIKCLDYSNVSESIPTFEDGERIIKLSKCESATPAPPEKSSYYLNKNDSTEIMFKNRGVGRSHEILPRSFDDALTNKEIKVSFDEDLRMCLKFE